MPAARYGTAILLNIWAQEYDLGIGPEKCLVGGDEILMNELPGHR
jgi:hypothetical protein